jgi:hypothetical protein
MRQNKKWRVEDTAISLERAFGSVSQDLQIASWLRTHENKIAKCKTYTEAIEFVREATRQRKLGEF